MPLVGYADGIRLLRTQASSFFFATRGGVPADHSDRSFFFVSCAIFRSPYAASPVKERVASTRANLRLLALTRPKKGCLRRALQGVLATSSLFGPKEVTSSRHESPFSSLSFFPIFPPPQEITSFFCERKWTSDSGIGMLRYSHPLPS